MKTILATLAILLVGTMSTKAEAAQCKVELENGRGRVLEVFSGYGYDHRDACREALRDCRQVVRSGYYRARVQNCMIKEQRRRHVTKTCEASLIGPRGRTIQYFLGQASGQGGTGVKARACDKAARKCRRYKERNGRYRAYCEVERQGRRHRPSPPPVRHRRLVILDA